MGKKLWSYSAGERGRNRVRVSTDPRTGILRWNWTGQEVPISMKHRDQEKAKRQADALAAKLAEAEVVVPKKLTLKRLIDLYLREVTPTKGESKQDHDRRAAKLFLAAFGEDTEPKNLDRRFWDRFVQVRRRGFIEGTEPVRDRQVQYDLKFMISVLGWAVGVIEHGQPLLERNPWSAEIRRAQNWTMPREATPRRPAMTDTLRDWMIQFSPHWQFPLAMIMGRYTASRNNSVRFLRWEDVDLREETVCWRGEYDKSGREVTVVLLPEAVEVLRRAPRRLGSPWVFPSETNPEEPTPRDTFQTWLRRAKNRLIQSIEDPAQQARVREQLRGLGYHGEKRAAVRDEWFRNLDPKMKETFARTDHRTLISVYDDVSLDEMRRVIRGRNGPNPMHESDASKNTAPRQSRK